MTIQAILFDADGVIQTVSENRRERLLALLPKHSNVDNFIHELFKEQLPALCGCVSLEERLAVLLQRWSSTACPEEVLEILTMIDVHHPILHVIARIRESGIKCYLASNQPSHRAHHMSSSLGYRNIFDAEFYSCDIGYTKPSKEYFLHVLGAINVDPMSVLFLDDHEQNVVGARTAGLRASRFALTRAGCGCNVSNLIDIFTQYGISY